MQKELLNTFRDLQTGITLKPDEVIDKFYSISQINTIDVKNNGIGIKNMDEALMKLKEIALTLHSIGQAL